MAATVPAGRLRHRVELQERNTRAANDDAIGGFSDEWVLKSVHWARVEPLSGVEAYRADQLEGQLTHRVTTRYVADIGPEDRFVFKSRNLNIVSITNPEELNRYTVALCTEVTT